ncbi:MAG: SMP-30/gluconolactonase/LRE family protein [Candidatus Acidiferrum sp.]
MPKWNMWKILYFIILAVSLPFRCVGQAPPGGSIARLDPALDRLVAPGTKIEKIAGGFKFVEGPVWVRKPGYLLFSDIPANVINKWTPDGKVSPVVSPSGFTGTDDSLVGVPITNGFETVYLIGSNGVTLDKQGRIVFAAHGDRAIVRIEKNGKRTVLADRYEGKRLNSPNDLVYRSDGTLYFSDPTAGLRPINHQFPQKELPFNGVYLITKDGTLRLATKEVTFPNGLAFSPDEKYLYVDDTAKKLITRFEVQADGSLGPGSLFFDMSPFKEPGVADGMKLDKKGNLYCTGPGGILVISPEGKLLGTITAPELPANLAFGDSDGKTLYMAARTGLYRMRVKVEGIRP